MSSVEPKITFVLTNGERMKFVLPDDCAIASHLCPEAQNNLFAPTHLLFGNGTSLLGLRTSSISWMHIHGSIDLPWTFPFGADLIELISKETYETLVPLKSIATKLTITHEPVGTAMQTFIRMFSVDGAVHHFRVTTHTLSKATRLTLPEAMGKLHVYFAKHPDGGWVIINTQNLRHFEVHPGPVDLPDTVWSLTRLDE